MSQPGFMGDEKFRIFLSATDSCGLLPSLLYDLLLIDGPYPALFTCTDPDEERTFLVLCPSCEKADHQFIIVEVKPDVVISLLQNKATIRDVWGGEDTKVFVKREPKGIPQLTVTRIGDINPRYLPTPGYTMDASPGEFDEEIAILHQRQEKLNQKGACT